MIKSKSEREYGGLEIDLTGPNGNAMCLMAYAKQLAKQLGKDANAIIERMMSGDYENLIAVFEEEFGDMVTLYR
jgi:hypothetical protein